MEYRPNINWFPGHMAKALKEIEAKIKLIDVVLVLLDARIPRSSLNPKLQAIIGRKPTIYILTKKDLADEAITARWISFFAGENSAAIAVDLFRDNLTAISKIGEKLAIAIREKEKRKGLQPRPLRYLVVGIPNVGKSTLINRLARRKATRVADKPGVTRAQQYVKVNEKMETLDTPGVLWPDFADPEIGTNLALTGTIKREILPEDVLATRLITLLSRDYLARLNEFYKIEAALVTDEKAALGVIDEISKKRGYILPGGKIDYQRAFTAILKDFQSGKIARASLEVPR